tara:strand:+ start:581 stop:1219 length:639 start_codon:yes stop_codon:yes gene_type:complete
MRQHVNPLSKYFEEIEPIPPLREIFKRSDLPLHLDIGFGSGGFLFKLASENKNWNYLGIEIREKLVMNAKTKLVDTDINNLYFAFGNADNLIKDLRSKLPREILCSVSINFPDPWFKKKHHKRRVIQPDFLRNFSELMKAGSLLFIKTDVKELFQYMDQIILNSLIFEKLEISQFKYLDSYNPSQIKTERELYTLRNKVLIYKQIYKKNDYF